MWRKDPTRQDPEAVVPSQQQCSGLFACRPVLVSQGCVLGLASRLAPGLVSPLVWSLPSPAGPLLPRCLVDAEMLPSSHREAKHLLPDKICRFTAGLSCWGRWRTCMLSAPWPDPQDHLGLPPAPLSRNPIHEHTWSVPLLWFLHGQSLLSSHCSRLSPGSTPHANCFKNKDKEFVEVKLCHHQQC